MDLMTLKGYPRAWNAVQRHKHRDGLPIGDACRQVFLDAITSPPCARDVFRRELREACSDAKANGLYSLPLLMEMAREMGRQAGRACHSHGALPFKVDAEEFRYCWMQGWEEANR